MPSIIPTRFRTELARSFHRDIVNTINVPSGELNTVVSLDDLNYIYSGINGDTTFPDPESDGTDDRGRILSYTPGRIEVFVDGIKLSNSEYIANDGETIELLSAIGSSEKFFDISSIIFSIADVGSRTITVLTSGVDIATNTINYTSHPFGNGALVEYNNGGGLSIAGLTNETSYYVVNATENTFQLSLTLGGNSINFTGTGNNSQTFSQDLADSIVYESHGFLTGDAVLYNENNNTPIGGISDNSIYYVIRINDDTIKLAKTYEKATGANEVSVEPIDLVASGSDTDYLLTGLKTNVFAIENISAEISDPGNHLIQIVDHDLVTGDRVLYNENGSDTIPGLTDNTVYYVIRRSRSVIQIASSLTNAKNNVAIDLNTTGLAGTTYTLVRLSDNSVSIPRKLSLASVDTSTDIITIIDHQFSNGDLVTYYARGGTEIGGLTDGDPYYIINSDSNSFQLSLTQGGSVIDLTSQGNSNQTFIFNGEQVDTITLVNHDYETGQALIYNGETGSITGLTNGTKYYVIEIDDNNFKLAASYNDAISDPPTNILLDSPVVPGTFKFTGPLDQTVTVNTFSLVNFPNPRDYFYVFLSKPLSWTNDSIPPTPNDTRLEESEVKRNIMGVKKVSPSDVTLMARRIDWETGTVYTQYDDDVDLSEEDFYIFNSDNYRIYKCLDNNNGNVSTVKPGFSDPGPRTLSDGYTWQLIYEVPAADRLKFLTDDYIPVKFYGTSTRFDHNGTITELILENRGTGYTSVPNVLILGDGVGAQATATVSNGFISSVELLDGGSGYSFAFAYIYGGGGSGALVEAVIETTDLPNVINQDVASYAVAINGPIDKVEVVSSGSNYVAETTRATIKGDGTGASLQPIVSEGQIVRIEILDRGTGYSYAEVEILGDGTGAEGKAIISPQGGHGSNVPQELFATTIGISVNIEDFLDDFFLDNDFRQYGLIKNIKTYDNENTFSALTGNACYVIDVPDGTQYDLDDIITSGSGGRYVVAYVKDNTVYLLPLINNDEVLFNVDTQLRNETKNITSGLTVLSVTEPEISHRWGEVIYYNNITPLTREQFQTEKIKLYINF